MATDQVDYETVRQQFGGDALARGGYSYPYSNLKSNGMPMAFLSPSAGSTGLSSCTSPAGYFSELVSTPGIPNSCLDYAQLLSRSFQEDPLSLEQMSLAEETFKMSPHMIQPSLAMDLSPAIGFNHLMSPMMGSMDYGSFDRSQMPRRDFPRRYSRSYSLSNLNVKETFKDEETKASSAKMLPREHWSSQSPLMNDSYMFQDLTTSMHGLPTPTLFSTETSNSLNQQFVFPSLGTFKPHVFNTTPSVDGEDDEDSLTHPKKKIRGPRPKVNVKFACAVPGCNLEFLKYSQLKAHAEVHDMGKPKPYKCDLCPQSFSRSHDLKRHYYVHTNSKPFSCERCGKGFSRIDALKRHEKSVSEGKKVQCTPMNHPMFYSGQELDSLASHAATFDGSQVYLE